MKIPITGPAYDSGITSYNQQKCINWYTEGDGTADTSPARWPYILRPTPGIVEGTDFGDFTSGRASIVFRDIGYVILDNTFASVEETGVPSYIDILDTSEGAVSITGGSDGIIMADGTSAYFYSLTTNTFSKITDGDLPANPTYGGYLDGYYILIFANSEKVYYSLDATSWDALDFASANTTADYLTACLGDHEELWLFGTATTEVWGTTGDANAPILRRPGVLITKGCRAPNTIVAMDSTIYFMATDPAGGNTVLKMDGYSPKTISTDAINYQISTYTTTSDAYAFCHRLGRHEFYVLTFPTENVTWVYDASTNHWHQRTSIITLDPTDADYEPLLKAHRAKNHFYVYDTHWVLDQYTGAISYYDIDTYTEYDMPIYRQRRTSLMSTDYNPMAMVPRIQDHDNKLHSYYNLVLEMEPGIGTVSGQGSDPIVSLSTSPDGGHTWETQEDGHIGALGVYDEPIRWDMLGQARNLVLDFTISDPVNAVILGATVDVEKNLN